jgi:hypothetical protein
MRSLRQKRGGGVGRRDTREGREKECHRIMVGAEMVKGGLRRNELGEVIQNGAEKRKSRDQGREDIIKSLIIIYIYI